jgi:hypothetical protein
MVDAVGRGVNVTTTGIMLTFCNNTDILLVTKSIPRIFSRGEQGNCCFVFVDVKVQILIERFLYWMKKNRRRGLLTADEVNIKNHQRIWIF